MDRHNNRETSLFGIAVTGALLLGLAWLVTPASEDHLLGQSANKGTEAAPAMVADARTDAAKTPLSAASAVAEGEALVKRDKEGDALGRAMLAGKPSSVPAGEPITKAEWADAKQHLQAIAADAPEHAKAQAVLKAMTARDKKNAEFTAALDAKMKLDNRKKFAEKLEQSFLDLRMNADVTAIGPQYTVLRIKYALVSKVTANDLTKSGIIERAQAAGFKSVQFTDGYDETWTWKLN